MSDGYNEARALRVSELINDFRTLLVHISQLKLDATEMAEVAQGYVLMRQCVAEAQELLASQFDIQSIQNLQGDGEFEKVQLQRIILDASARRFQAHKIYQRMAAARRWAMGRAQVLQDQRPSSHHTAALAALDDTLRTELSRITDSYVLSTLASADVRAGYWLNEDPSLSTILNWIWSHS
ncbi:hypothetical protein H112_07612 [Trichophyton rubrum D6]|uniref:Uncharacterized protein n=4 Tax=Trichophyton TaxID=5550 RepID=A0A178EU75_TRIRU|nr:uncharacterized protein TERG_00213 [Trichophyton rubrum CBS 118892]EZF11263.1 hypothetical protein H100_07639 [Trichophyton rubrum MR850]EZF38137.1 hypothetical protein H102_07603 [Trichophyton rubrum CBS 100081]EZF48804.1 hypothetical protein H103_07625 [Trichophyton rubrum CBS 288.86]EZF59393.1 hypothetical protein H104_07574 [Trichophyton rubrum CBS 289.86]EZF80726.1 hypothetical protein H110_07622 [Trichophyton rubrum MR1448]EZF91407.1 hypothetical protein H113_07682 [Trichophyton rubr